MSKSDNNDQKSEPESESASRSGKSARRRRRLIKGTIAAGVTVAVAEKWITPKIRSVMLPAHAQTSGYDVGSQEDDDTFLVDSRVDDDPKIG
jgi:tellurite resistance protein